MRGQYNELNSYPAWVSKILSDLNGRAWTIGFESTNSKGGFESVNADVYGYAEVLGQKLCVVQLRQASKRKSGYFTRVRKDYYLCGYNENGNSFAHPVESPCRSKKALTTNEGVVLKVLAEVWQCDAEDVSRIRRNGDFAFVPVTAREFNVAVKDAVEIDGVTLDNSHTIIKGKRGQLFSTRNGQFYCKGEAKISHEKGQHPTAIVDSRLWRIQHAIRFSHWGFTQPTSD